MGRLTPLQAIHKACVECFGGAYKSVRGCTSLKCPLYEYRMGSNPARKGTKGSFTTASLKRNDPILSQKGEVD